MKRNSMVITLSILVASGSAVSLFLVFKKRKQDQLATKITTELTKLLKPTTSGLLAENAFDVNYKDEVIKSTSRKILTLKNDVAIEHAHKINAAWGHWWTGGDNETEVYSVFRKLQDKVQVSQVADAYLKIFKVNLIDRLNEKLDETEIKIILDIIQVLPAFRSI